MSGVDGCNDNAVAGENQEGNDISSSNICSQAPVYGLNSTDGLLEQPQQQGTIQAVPWRTPPHHSTTPFFGLGMPYFSGPAVHQLNYFSEPGEYSIVQFSQEPVRSGTHAEPGLSFQTSWVTGDYGEIRNNNIAHVTDTGIETPDAEVGEEMEVGYFAEEEGVNNEGVISGAVSGTDTITVPRDLVCQKEEDENGNAAQPDTAPIPHKEENNENENPTEDDEDNNMEIDSCCANLLSLEIRR